MDSTCGLTNTAVVSCVASGTEAATRLKRRLFAATIETRDVSACVYNNNTTSMHECMNVDSYMLCTNQPL